MVKVRLGSIFENTGKLTFEDSDGGHMEYPEGSRFVIENILIEHDPEQKTTEFILTARYLNKLSSPARKYTWPILREDIETQKRFKLVQE